MRRQNLRRESDRFFRRLVAGMRNGVLAYKRDGTLALINDEAYRIFGVAPNRNDLGRPVAEVLRDHPELLRVLHSVFDLHLLPNRVERRLRSGKVIGYTLALVRLALARDADMLPFLDGTKVKPASIGRAEVSVSPVGGASRLLYRPEAEEMPDLLDGMTGRRCPGYVPLSVGDASDGAGESPCVEGFWEASIPHWQQMPGMETRPAPMALELTWSEPPSAVRFALGIKGKGVDVSRDRTLDVRVANDPDAAPAALQVRVRDTSGRSAVLRTDLDALADAWAKEGAWQGRTWVAGMHMPAEVVGLVALVFEAYGEDPETEAGAP